MDRGSRGQPAIDVAGLREVLDDMQAGQRATLEGLRADVDRLRATVADLESLAPSLAYTQPAEPPPPSWLTVDIVLLAAGAFTVGLLLGGAWQRHRSRRERMLRF